MATPVPLSPCLSFRCASGGGSMKKFCFQQCRTARNNQTLKKVEWLILFRIIMYRDCIDQKEAILKKYFGIYII
jgi:hypothetical protein